MEAIIFHIPTVDEEFENVWGLYKEMQRFREGFYRLQLPDHQDFLTAAIYAPYFYRKNEKELLYEVFKNEIFDASAYSEEVENLKGQYSLLSSVVEMFSSWSRFAPFYTPAQYTVNVTKYGPGGGYNAGAASVTVLISRKFTKKPVVYTIAHEMVHIGIEKPLIKQYAISFKDKETIAEWICAVHLSHLLPDYPIQPSLNRELYDLLGQYPVSYLWDHFSDVVEKPILPVSS